VHYHNIMGGLAGVVHTYLLKSIDLETIDIEVYACFHTRHCSTVGTGQQHRRSKWPMDWKVAVYTNTVHNLFREDIAGFD
jgi:hypothetical protein